jgi:hypothetical protein
MKMNKKPRENASASQKKKNENEKVVVTRTF